MQLLNFFSKKTKKKKSTLNLKKNNKKVRLLLDEEGRLFGKYDLFKPLLFVVIATLLFLIGRVLLQKDTYIEAELFASGGEWWWNNPDPPYWLSDPIQAGSIEYDPQGKVLVEVLEVRKFEFGQKKRLWMKVRLRVTPSYRAKQYRFRREPLQIGKVIQVSPNNVNVNANVVGIQGVGALGEEVEKIITLKSYDLLPWFADAIKVGDQMKDNNGRVLAEIVDKKVENFKVFASDYLGAGHITENEAKREALITMKIRARRIEGIDYFAEFQPIKIGFFIMFPFSNLNLEGHIIDVRNAE